MSRAAKTVSEPIKQIQIDLNDVARAVGSRLWEVFRDWMECCALSISNSTDHAQFEEREARYMQHVERYGKENMVRFAHALAQITLALETESSDLLGKLFMSLEFGEASMGQFFTPYDISRLMAGMTLDDGEIKALVEKNGFVTFNEPACGSGGMVVAFAEKMRENGLNPQTQLHVTAQDLDPVAVHMAYVQLSLLGIPAIVIHGNTLTLETRSVWRTPFHMLYGWEWKRAKHEALEEDRAAAPVVESPATHINPYLTEQLELF